MGLQTDNLTMVAVGVLGNQPPNVYQQPLIDGIHLRWGFLRELGFPWHGFYLFRRLAQSATHLCLSAVTGGLQAGVLPETKYYSAIGLVSSNTNLVLTDDFALNDRLGFALDGRDHLRLELRPGELARSVELQIGFRSRCLDIGTHITFPSAPQPPNSIFRSNPLTLEGVTFAVKDFDGSPAANTRFDSLNTTAGTLVGLSCGYGLTIKLPSPSNSVKLLLTRVLQPASIPSTVAAFDIDNNQVAITTLQSPANQPETVELNGQNIARIEVSGFRHNVYLHRICSDSLGTADDGDAINVTAFAGGSPVRSGEVVFKAGQIVTFTLEADAIDAVELSAGQAALVDLCYVPVAQDATQGWETLERFSYPMGLPVSQPDYPCSVANPQSLITDRVHYQLPAEWDGSTFTELHQQLVKLVEGGPSSAPMADRVFDAPAAVSNPPDPNPPELSTFYLLDMALLGTLHPALAQLLGLYWVDQTAELNVSYDYLIVADHTGAGEHNPDQVLEDIRKSGFTRLDGYIVFNKSLTADSPLPVPSGLQIYELPGGAFPDVDSQLPQVINNTGISWDLGLDDSEELLPESQLLYLVWRADLGNEAAPSPTGTFSLVTKLPPDKPKPVLVTEPRLPNGFVPERSADWPADPIHFIDRNLPDGWYDYAVSGIDIFGRHSANSGPARIRLLDKIPPPVPTAVEAFALDPQDRFLHRDDAYKDWHTSLDPSIQQTLIGLRVRWRWTRAHERQAPDTKEFRLYFHPGADLPPDHDRAINWQERYYVVEYNDNFAIDAVNGERVYEIFLPPAPASNSPSISLSPSLTEPVVYAHISVSAADDKPHTADLRATGDWGNRPGNEGSVGPPAKIYRVWRELPSPPGDIFAGERLQASAADYHHRSFFTYRWQPQPQLNLHLFRALDDAIFKADWDKRTPTTLLSASQVEFFPAGWNEATRQSVADELNLLSGFVATGGFNNAMAHYRQLSDRALRVLAGLPNSESAFIQITINPLREDDPANDNRLGPDNPDELALDMNQRAFTDTLDGRATNRYFYRAAFVDNAHNLGPLGLSSPPVYLPNVVPPRAPAITKVLGGDREIAIKWASNREPDLAGYRVYRTDSEENARDLRLMLLVHTESVPVGDPLLRPAEVTWTDTTVPGLVLFYYRLVAIDDAGNASIPSRVLRGRAFDDSRPEPPNWNPPSAGAVPEEIILSWSSPDAALTCLIQRSLTGIETWSNLSGWLPRGTYIFHDSTRTDGQTYDYRLRVMDANGRLNRTFNVLTQ